MTIPRKYRHLPLLLWFPVLSANGATINIDFDFDASGNPIAAPSAFASTTRLTDLYAILGVHFIGPGGNDGGAILNVLGGFGVNPRSGSNFLAFNNGASMSNGGVPRGPQIISFTSLMSHVSIHVAGGSGANTFVMQAFDVNGISVDSDTITTGPFGLLEVAYMQGIKSVSVSSTGPDGVFVFDDLAATAVPETSSSLLLGMGMFCLLTKRRRK